MKKSESSFNVILSFISFTSAIISFFVMYYIFAGVALVSGVISVRDDRARKLSLTAIAIVCVTLVIKLINVAIVNGNLPDWLIKGF